MNTYTCRRDGNALEWRTHPYRPGGDLCCWQCEQRLRNGLPLLPERVETPIEAIVAEAEQDRADAAERAEAKRQLRGIREAARTREQDKQSRTMTPAWRAHLARVRPNAERARKALGAELYRGYWQRKAEQLGLGDVA